MRHYLIPAVLLFLGPLLPGCSPPAPSAQAATPVRVTRVQPVSGTEGLRYSASIEPRAQTSLSFQSQGQVTEILLFQKPDGSVREIQLGDPVVSGELLARLDESGYRDKVKTAASQVAVALAGRQKAEADFRRASNLFATQSITAPDYDQARKEYQTALAQTAGAQAGLDEAELALQHCTLSAPWPGVVLQRNIQIGQLVDAQIQAFTVADVSSVKAVFGVPDIILKDVRIGTPLALQTDAYPGRKFAGRVSAVSPAADSQTRVFEVEVTTPNPDGALKIGMIGSLVLPEESRPSLVIPLGAVVRDPANPNAYAVYVVETRNEESIAVARTVELGRVVANEISVTSGLRPGERLIVNGATRVIGGKPVHIIP